jgi:hypothetical protein
VHAENCGKNNYPQNLHIPKAMDPSPVTLTVQWIHAGRILAFFAATPLHPETDMGGLE